MPPLVIVFARAPVGGRVKTRLGLESHHAAQLHEAFVRDTLALVSVFPAIELSTDEATNAWPECEVIRSVQPPGDLGVRLLAALADGLARDHSPVLILGSDSPTLPAGHLRALLDCTADAALGPTEDGGFYAISCRRTAAAMFAGVEWSTPGTLATTLAALRCAGLSTALGPAWYDVDDPASLARLARDPRLGRHTKSIM